MIVSRDTGVNKTSGSLHHQILKILITIDNQEKYFCDGTQVTVHNKQYLAGDKTDKRLQEVTKGLLRRR